MAELNRHWSGNLHSDSEIATAFQMGTYGFCAGNVSCTTALFLFLFYLIPDRHYHNLPILHPNLQHESPRMGATGPEGQRYSAELYSEAMASLHGQIAAYLPEECYQFS